eukprot:12913240-Prorocentrum_lima.AAC.1
MAFSLTTRLPRSRPARTFIAGFSIPYPAPVGSVGSELPCQCLQTDGGSLRHDVEGPPSFNSGNAHNFNN